MSKTHIYIVSQDARGRLRLRSARQVIREGLVRQLREVARRERKEATP
mgnify:CR=1 FL=1|jgi:hypothetical protein